MERFFAQFRFISFVGIICSLGGSVLMFVVGFLKTYDAFNAVFFGHIPKEKMIQLNAGDIATTYLIKSVDAFLIAFVLFIFAYGTYTLFVAKGSGGERKSGILGWIDIQNINQLKNVLAELIVIILFVKFLEVAIINVDNLRWEILILPISILLLVISIKYLGLGKKPQ